MSRRLAWAALAAIVAAFLLGASRSLSLPGLWYDEAMDADLGVELALDLPRTRTDWSVSLGGQTWPLRVPHAYDFSVFTIYLSALAFRVAGVSAAALRGSALAMAACLLVALYAFSRQWFSARASLAACALLAAHPSFFVWSRVGFFANEIFLLAFAVAALALGSRWLRGGPVWALYAGCFVLGFCANCSTKALAFLIAVPALYAVFVPRARWPTKRQAGVALACGLAGALNPLLYCLTSGHIFGFLLHSLTAPTRVGVDNWAFSTNAQTRWRQLLTVLDGRNAAGHAGPGIVIAMGLPSAAIASLVACVAFAAAGRDAGGGRRLGALAALAAVLFAETCFTPMGLNEQHLLVVLPFALLAIPAALDEAASRAPAGWRRALAAGLASAAFVVLLGSECRADASYFSALRRSGGTGLWSDAIYDAQAYLESRGIDKPYALSWGLACNLYLLSGGRIDPIELHNFQREPDARLLRLMDDAVRKPDSAYLVFSDGISNLGQRKGAWLALRREAEAAHESLVVEREFRSRLGMPVIALYRAAPSRR